MIKRSVKILFYRKKEHKERKKKFRKRSQIMYLKKHHAIDELGQGSM